MANAGQGGKKKIWMIIVAVLLVILIWNWLGDEDGEYIDDSDYDYNSEREWWDDDDSDDWWDDNGSTDDNEAGNGWGWGNDSYQDASQDDAPDVTSVATGDGTATILVYCIGSNLESESGCATADFKEMMAAGRNSNVNVIIQTGGAKSWRNSWVSANKVQRFKVAGNSLELLDEQKKVSMVETSTLSDFISWGAKNYPADKMGFVFWDHGGGTICGFGVDDNFEGGLTLANIYSAFRQAGIHFDFVGFDACLMGTVETAYALSPFADYLIASEEEEPGNGWYYTGWLKALNENPSIETSQLGTKIVKDFVSGPDAAYWSNLTLSVIDLKKVPALYKELCEFMDDADVELSRGGFKKIASARSKAKSYGGGDYEQIDIADFVNKSGISGNALLSALDDAIVYHKTNMNGTNGLAMYFPYSYASYYKQMKSVLRAIDMDEKEYERFFSDFLSVMSGGSVSSRAISPMEKLTGFEGTAKEDYTSEEWYNSSVVSDADISSAFELNEYGNLDIYESGDTFILPLTDEQWDEIAYIDTWVYLDDGEGYIDLGSDNTYEIDDDDNLKVDFDYSWIALDGQVVPFYAGEEEYRSDNSWYTFGSVYAQLTDTYGESKDIEIVLYWDDKNPDGVVLGYRDDNGHGPAPSERNLQSFEYGDKIDFYCEYYSYDGEYEDEYLYGDTLTVDGDIEVSYEEIGDFTTEVCLHITDIYNNDYWTDSVIYEVD